MPFVQDRVNCLMAFENRLWSGSENGSIRVWDTQGVCVKYCRGHEGAVNCLLIVGDNIWSGGADSRIGIWNKKGENVKVAALRFPCALPVLSGQVFTLATCYGCGCDICCTLFFFFFTGRS